MRKQFSSGCERFQRATAIIRNVVSQRRRTHETILSVFLLLLVIAWRQQVADQPAAAPATSARHLIRRLRRPLHQTASSCPKIVMFNWTDYIDPDLYGESNFSSVRVIEDNYSATRNCWPSCKAAARLWSSCRRITTVGIAIEEGLLAKLDHANIPHLSNLADRLYPGCPTIPWSVYCVPHVGYHRFSYDSTKVDPPASWSVFFEPDPNSGHLRTRV